MPDTEPQPESQSDSPEATPTHVSNDEKEDVFVEKAYGWLDFFFFLNHYDIQVQPFLLVLQIWY